MGCSNLPETDQIWSAQMRSSSGCWLKILEPDFIQSGFEIIRPNSSVSQELEQIANLDSHRQNVVWKKKKKKNLLMSSPQSPLSLSNAPASQAPASSLFPFLFAVFAVTSLARHVLTKLDPPNLSLIEVGCGQFFLPISSSSVGQTSLDFLPWWSCGSPEIKSTRPIYTPR